jgi:hypothetical protein
LPLRAKLGAAASASAPAAISVRTSGFSFIVNLLRSQRAAPPPAPVRVCFL